MVLTICLTFVLVFNQSFRKIYLETSNFFEQLMNKNKSFLTLLLFFSLTINVFGQLNLNHISTLREKVATKNIHSIKDLKVVENWAIMPKNTQFGIAESVTEPLSSNFSMLEDTLSERDKRRQKWGKAVALGGSSVVVFGGLYMYAQGVWWKDQARSFHFDWDKDYRYANNLDKMGHFMGGLMVADAYYDGFRWLNMSERKAAWWGFAMGFGLQVAVEMKDAFGPYWGFSVGDVTLGGFGALQPLLKQKSNFFKNTDFKISYWQRSTRYFDNRGWQRQQFELGSYLQYLAKPTPNAYYPNVFHIDDFLNQTYWMTTSLRYITANKVAWIPDWLGLSVGWGIEAESWDTNPNYPGSGGKPEFYLAPDIDWVKLFKPKSRFWRMALKRLNYIKCPMPTLQLTQKPKLWGIYF